ncbi:hypothetical protein PMIN01_02492 [Paraphaeosphaeria minitans]|uniref:Uncharacterized protein n=1 Tax=Paraphaeosphaeria minitans TaxID=565426 RepID=A0A9P6GRE7_9PLEO|nr:hypothetical protein PMIN01_02492 [Paraphaeosphaeria minitans]
MSWVPSHLISYSYSAALGCLSPSSSPRCVGCWTESAHVRVRGVGGWGVGCCGLTYRVGSGLGDGMGWDGTMALLHGAFVVDVDVTAKVQTWGFALDGDGSVGPPWNACAPSNPMPTHPPTHLVYLVYLPSEAKRSLMSVCHRSTAPKKAIHAEQKHCWVPGSAFEMVPTYMFPSEAGLGYCPTRSRPSGLVPVYAHAHALAGRMSVCGCRAGVDGPPLQGPSVVATYGTYLPPPYLGTLPPPRLPTHPSIQSSPHRRYATLRYDQTPPPTKRNPSHPMMDPRDATPTHLRPTRSRRSHYSSVRALGSRQTSYR